MKRRARYVEQMERRRSAGDADTYHLLNLQFHDALVEFAGNRKLAGVYRKLVKELALYRRRNLRDEATLPLPREHRDDPQGDRVAATPSRGRARCTTT